MASSYELKDKPNSKLSDASPIPAYEGESYTTQARPTEHRSFWQRSIDSFKPPIGEHAPHNAHDVEMNTKPVRPFLTLSFDWQSGG